MIFLTETKCKIRFIYRVSLKKRYFSDFFSYFSSRGRILLFHMCFGIRISSPFHLAIQKVSIPNLNCPKNACADMILIQALRCEAWAVVSVHNSMYLITLDSPKITGFQNKHSMKILDNMDVDCGMYSTFMEENSTFMEDHKK